MWRCGSRLKKSTSNNISPNLVLPIPRMGTRTIQHPSHHQIAQGGCRSTLCLTTKEEIILALLLLELLETSLIQRLQFVVVVIFKDLIKFIHPRLCGHRCPDYSRYPMSRRSRGSYSTSPPSPDISSSHSAAFAGLARRPGPTEVSLVHHPAHDISGSGINAIIRCFSLRVSTVLLS